MLLKRRETQRKQCNLNSFFLNSFKILSFEKDRFSALERSSTGKTRKKERCMICKIFFFFKLINILKEKRPFSTQEETNLRRAERWRTQVIREVAKKVAQIQNGILTFLF